MTVVLNHIIVPAYDKQVSAQHLVDLLGLGEPTAVGRFVVVQLDNGVSLDFADDAGPVPAQHYAFGVAEAAFDDIVTRIRIRGLPHWAGPFHRGPGEIGHRAGARHLYWDDPSGHSLEILTEPSAT